MKLVHVITGLLTGGAERALYNLLGNGLAQHFNNHVISLGDEGTIGPQIQELGVPVTTLGMRSGRLSLSGLLKLRRVIRDIRPDIIQGWMYHGNLIAKFARNLAPGCPVLAWNVRQTLYDLKCEKRATRYVIRANRFLSSLPDAIIYNSEISRTQHEAFGFNNKRSRVIPNGFDLARWSPDAETRATIRTELGVPDGSMLIGHIARFHPMKDHRALLQAFGKIVSKFPQTHFLLAGRGVDLDNPELTPWLAELPTNRMHLLGERSDVERLMASLDVLCLSSAWGEAFPNVLGEAMACSVPCVSTDVGDSRTIVGNTGFIVPPEDPQALAEALSLMLEKSSKELAALSHAARERVRNCYGLQNVVNEYASLYEELTL